MKIAPLLLIRCLSITTLADGQKWEIFNLLDMHMPSSLLDLSSYLAYQVQLRMEIGNDKAKVECKSIIKSSFRTFYIFKVLELDEAH